MLSYTVHENSPERPWVTFIHGAGGSSSIWYKQVRAFRKEFNVLLIDLRGHGRSKSIDLRHLDRYRFDAIGDDVLEVLDHLKISASHFVGISLGTVIIREIAERFPERVSSMIQGGAVMKLNLRGQFLMRLGVMLKSVVPYLLLYRFFALIIMPRRNHRESRNFFINEARNLYQREFRKWFALAAQVNPLLALFRFRDPGIPTLYVMGEQDHMFLPSIRKLVENHPSASLFVVADCGHVVNIEQASHFNQISIDFLRGLELRTEKKPPIHSEPEVFPYPELQYDPKGDVQWVC